MAKVAILIHGTFAGPKAGVKQWYEFGSEDKGSFINRVEEALRDRGDQEPIAWHIFSWSGANTHSERLAAAEALYRLIKDAHEQAPGRDMILLAHSHGGNVALKALELLWRRSAEGRQVFEALIRALGIKRIGSRATTTRIVTSFPELSQISDGLRKFLDSAALVSEMILRLHGIPRLDADHATREQWMERMRRAPLVAGLEEPFCVRWSAERRPAVHLVTMGTPFFQKIWNPLPSLKCARAWVATIATASLVAGAIVSILWALSKSRFHWITGDLYPLGVLSIWAQLAFIIVLLGVFTRVLERRGDTNMYFDISAAYGEESLRPSDLPWRLSIIQAGLLDEALLALSAEPLIFAELAPRLKRPLTPRVSWRLPPNPTGEGTLLIMSPEYLLKMIRRAAALVVRWAYNVTFGFALRLVGWVATLAAHRFLLRALLRSISSGGFGIPEHEFHAARVEVEPIPALGKFFKMEMWDATQALVEEAPPPPTSADRHAKWGFLWDDEQLRAAVPSSQIWKRLNADGNPISRNRGIPSDADDSQRLQRVSLALEERLREASGLVPLNHSGYYTNGKVISKVAEFLAAGDEHRRA